jgi:hypothetical protein
MVERLFPRLRGIDEDTQVCLDPFLTDVFIQPTWTERPFELHILATLSARNHATPLPLLRLLISPRCV